MYMYLCQTSERQHETKKNVSLKGYAKFAIAMFMKDNGCRCQPNDYYCIYYGVSFIRRRIYICTHLFAIILRSLWIFGEPLWFAILTRTHFMWCSNPCNGSEPNTTVHLFTCWFIFVCFVWEKIKMARKRENSWMSCETIHLNFGYFHR